MIRKRRRPLSPPSAESGFTLLEVVVAMVIFTIFCAATAGVMVRVTQVTRGNLQRTAAANLAAEQIQLARSTSAAAIATLSRTQVVANTTYTIAQTATYLASDSTSSICDGSSASIAYKLVTVSVTWPGMGSIQPVRADTLKSFGVGSNGLGGNGALAIAIAGADGTPRSGVAVTLSNASSVVTGADGCALFIGLLPGTYSATLDSVGFVGSALTQAVTKNGLGVSAGALTRATMSYDSARRAVVAIDSPLAGASVPATLPLRLSSTSLTEATPAACPASGTPTSICGSAPSTSSTGSAKELYPGIYTVKLGSCLESAPSQIALDLTLAGADGSTATVPMGAATVKVSLTASPSTGISGRTITLAHAAQSGSGCTSGESYTMTSVSSGSSLLLPYGTWVISAPVLNASGATVGTSSATVTLSATSRTSSTQLLVLT